MTTSPTPSESLVSPTPAPLTSPHPSDESQAATAEISISFVSVSALSLLARLPSSHPQYIFCSGIIDPPTCNARLAFTSLLIRPAWTPPLDTEYGRFRSHIPEVYHQYLGVFIKQNAVALPPCRLYDRSTVLEDHTTPPFGPIYSLSEVERLRIRNFLDKNLTNEFIRHSQSSAGAPILFIKKKDCSHCLRIIAASIVSPKRTATHSAHP